MKTLVLFEKSSFTGWICFFFVVLELFCGVGSWARKCRCRGMCMLVFIAKEASVVVGESEANKGTNNVSIELA